jgi:hypothetical protein
MFPHIAICEKALKINHLVFPNGRNHVWKQCCKVYSCILYILMLSPLWEKYWRPSFFCHLIAIKACINAVTKFNTLSCIFSRVSALHYPRQVLE